MNSIHDMGGLHGFGKVDVEENEPVFHARWEGRVYAMTQIIDNTGIWNLDEHRHEIELMPSEDYIADGYYGRWLFAMESILARKNILHRKEVDKRILERAHDQPETPADPENRNWPLQDEEKIRWGALRHEAEVTPKFKVGDKVRTRNHQPPGHTRLTAFIRCKSGVISKVNAQAWVYPDTRAHNTGENLQPVYNVLFEAQELWGDQAEPNTKIHVDLSEDYLELAQ